MKPIIIEMKDLRDSVEVYESKPGRVLVCTIYIIFGLFVSVLLWMAFSEIEIVVKADGMFRYDETADAAGKIYPGQTTDFYAEVYVENADILKLREGQRVTFEIAACPSDEYGYFTGQIEEIHKDVTVDAESGEVYYPVRIACDNNFVKSKEGEQVALINGLMCRAKVIVDEENVLQYFLRKMDLLN